MIASGGCTRPIYDPTQRALLLAALVDAVRANNPDFCRDAIDKGLDLLDYPTLLTVLVHHALEAMLPEERDRLLGWQMGVVAT